MQIIDVTLRESVFQDPPILLPQAVEIIKLLSETTVDYIEIGYLKNSTEETIPLLLYSSDYINMSYEACGKSKKLVAMIHPRDFLPSRFDKDALEKLFLIRITCTPQTIIDCKPIIEYFTDIGVKVSINLLRSSKYSPAQCVEQMKIAKKIGAYSFYIADSNGHLLPHEVRDIVKALKQEGEGVKIGFHPHDNLQMAMVNAMEAMRSGVDIIDASLLGYGKGAGNLRTELLPIITARFGKISKNGKMDNIKHLYKAAKFFSELDKRRETFEDQFNFALFGFLNIDLDIAKGLLEKSHEEGRFLLDIMSEHSFN